MFNDFNSRREEDILVNIPRACDKIKEAMPELNLLKETINKEQSVVNDSVNQINNSFDNSGDSIERSNVRVRKLEAPGGVPLYREPVVDTHGGNYYNGFIDNSTQGYNSSNTGVANTLILISTAVLVTLVVLVSLYIMKTMGL